MNQGRNSSEGNEELELTNDSLRAQLANASNLRSAEDRELWRIFQIFWAANAILLVALFSNGDLPTNLVGTVISGVGFGMSAMWSWIQHRVRGHVLRYERLIEKLERRLRMPPEYAVSSEINREDYQRYLGKGPRTGTIMIVCGLAVTIVWFITFVLFMIRLAC